MCIHVRKCIYKKALPREHFLSKYQITMTTVLQLICKLKRNQEEGVYILHQSPLFLMSLLHLLTVACLVCLCIHTYHSFVVATLNTQETQQTVKPRVSTLKE